MKYSALPTKSGISKMMIFFVERFKFPGHNCSTIGGTKDKPS